MSDASIQIIEDIVDYARKNGVAARKLAEIAGVTETSLSRLRKNGRYHSDTLFSLAQAAGMKIVVMPAADNEHAENIIDGGFF